MSHRSPAPLPRTGLAAAALACLWIAGCSGGGTADRTAQSSAGVGAQAASGEATGTARGQGVKLPAVPASPTFHMMPVELDAPSDADALWPTATAGSAPRTVVVPAAQAGLDTRRLTPQALDAATSRAHALAASGRATPAVSPLVSAVYTPAQMRAAYGLPDLPGVPTPTADQLAAMGSGQTIYIIDAHDDPNVFNELSAFSTKFGLPACTRVPLAATLQPPLAPPPAGCTFSKVLSTPSGGFTAAVPSYDAGWASEIALDVQWAHAMAPYARIVLVEAATASVNDLLGSVKAANTLGGGVVSMSFGAGEGSWSASADPVFTVPGFTYLASTGDSGAAVNWPAVSPGVVAVGGTTLSWTGSGPRAESAWSGSGGGISAYEALPAWQNNVAIAGGGTLAMRAVADVSLNADPASGQYVAIIPPGGTAARWYAYGGTSISSPQWAGILAVSNAQRVAAGKALLGDPHAMLYGDVAAVPGAYSAAFADIVSGSDGGCGTCASGTGFDQATGWGTPNVDALLPLLLAEGQVVPVNHPPVMSGGQLAATTGTAYSGQVAGTDPDGDSLAYRLVAGPAGLGVAADGTLSWARPVKGTYAVKVQARDPGGLAATGTWTLVVKNPNLAPVMPSAAAKVTAGQALSVPMAGRDPNGDAITYSLGDGAQDGMVIGPMGGVHWTSPVAGHYVVKVLGTDPGGLVGTGTLTLDVLPPDNAPTLAAGAIVTAPGVPFSRQLQAQDVDGDKLGYIMSGGPRGLTLSPSGLLSWNSPVKGTWTLAITVGDGRGMRVTALWKFTVRS